MQKIPKPSFENIIYQLTADLTVAFGLAFEPTPACNTLWQLFGGGINALSSTVLQLVKYYHSTCLCLSTPEWTLSCGGLLRLETPTSHMTTLHQGCLLNPYIATLHQGCLFKPLHSHPPPGLLIQHSHDHPSPGLLI